MRILKPITFSFATLVLLASCGTSKVSFKDKMMLNATDVPLKKASISDDELKRWSHLDIITDTIPGMSVDRAYSELLQFRTPKPVIVAVIDSGIDINHEDMQGKVWVNSKEIPNNGIDDDKNGYTDDINGWNYLGDITKENLEYTRIYHNPKLVDKATFAKVKEMVEGNKEEAIQGKAQIEQMIGMLTASDAVIAKLLNKADYTAEEVAAIKSTDEEVLKSKNMLSRFFQFGLPIGQLKIEIQKEYDKMVEMTEEDAPFTDYRKVLGDNPDDLTDTQYGNNNVIGPDPGEALHGTHVAGIIAQTRGNDLGGDGVVKDNVLIMALRAVPDGDEYDKDIALAIRYAVDNGAKVINASFGKSFSPHKEWVWDALKYAAEKDVLFVHAAGNDGKDIDTEDNFPTNFNNGQPVSDAFLEIGALNFEYGDKVVANFSNYGKKSVSIFSPGVKIYATTPENGYQYLQGTSMASPNAAGVAALIRSYYPKLSAQQVRQIIMDSGVTIAKDVVVGGDPKDSRSFSELSQTGKVINAYNALLLADKMSK
jgi:subtilisin family serine protease